MSPRSWSRASAPAAGWCPARPRRRAGAALELPALATAGGGRGQLLRFELVGLTVEEEGGRDLGGCRRSMPGVANDVLELDSGLALPLVEDCVRASRSGAGADPVSRRIRPARKLNLAADADRRLHPGSARLRVADRAATAGGRARLRARSALLSYRDYTPLTGGQVDDEPYGGGAGMVLRVDVVCAALEAVYGERRGAAGDRALARKAPARPGARGGARPRKTS